ncbi:MAG: N-acyl homoserine lactonase family protein [Eubacteriales bacterium]|nr:N-acyl homoserine lactonase family protein [Eubacteriales bacterium]
MKGIKVYILNTGYIYNDADYNHAHINVGTIDNPSPKHVWETVPSYCVLIDHPTEGWILFDTGCDVNALETWPDYVMQSTPYIRKSEDDNLLVQLAKLGLEPKDISKVILSHFHVDHAGNIGLFAETADIYVSEEEASYAFRGAFEDNKSEMFGFYKKSDIKNNYKKLHYLTEDEELFEGVEVFTAYGHTPGHIGMIVHLENRTLLFPADQVKNQDNYDGNPGSLVSDSVAWYASAKKVHKLEKKYNAEVFFSHDLKAFEKMKKCPEYYA